MGNLSFGDFIIISLVYLVRRALTTLGLEISLSDI